MIDESMTVASLIADLRDEIRRVTKERDKLRNAQVASNETWQVLREILVIGPADSVLDAVEKLKKSQTTA